MRRNGGVRGEAARKRAARAAVLSGVAFGTLWGLATWFVLWRYEHDSPPIALGAGVLAGLLFGSYVWIARRP